MASPHQQGSSYTTVQHHQIMSSDEDLSRPSHQPFPGQHGPGMAPFPNVVLGPRAEASPLMQQPQFPVYAQQGTYLPMPQGIGGTPSPTRQSFPVPVAPQPVTLPSDPGFIGHHVRMMEPHVTNVLMPPFSAVQGTPFHEQMMHQQFLYQQAVRQAEDNEIAKESVEITQIEQQLQQRRENLARRRQMRHCQLQHAQNIEFQLQQPQNVEFQYQSSPQTVVTIPYMSQPPERQPSQAYAYSADPVLSGQAFHMVPHGSPINLSSIPQGQNPYSGTMISDITSTSPEQQPVFVPSSSESEPVTESMGLGAGHRRDTTIDPNAKAAEHLSFVTQDTQASIQQSQLREEADVFVPTRDFVKQSATQQPYYQLYHPSSKRHRKQDRQPSGPTSLEGAKLAQHKIIVEELYSYALRTMSDSSEHGRALQNIKSRVIRVPPICFNEQKIEGKPEGHKVLLQPQSPALRGQEALARVCFAIEQILQQRNTGATIISDYKFKESYLRNAPAKVRDVLNVPEDEGSHDILVIGPDIGIICVQVTCIEATTNSGTVKKQVRETLKQLEKDVKVIKHVLADLHLDIKCVRKVMALPNITSQDLKQKLEPSFVKVMAGALDTDEDLNDLLTLDRLPCVGHRHWSSEEPRDELLSWLDRLLKGPVKVSLENYMQIFARYTCSWSVVEVWGVTKPRRQIRSLAQAVAETANRHHLPVLTADEDNLLRSGESHVVIEAPAGTGVTELLQVRARMELRKGSDVLIFIPKLLTDLREKYEDFAKNDTQYTGNVYFWFTEEAEARKGKSVIRFKSVTGDTATLSSLRGKKNMFAVFDRVNRNKDLNHLLTEVTNTASSVWAVKDVATKVTLPKEKYKLVHLSTMTRVPSSIQALIKYGLQQGPARTQPAGASATNPKEMSLSLPKDHQNVAEVSSYVGLPTDGPSPLFIWHPEGPSTNCTILQCELCMSLLRTALVELLGDLVLKSIGDEESSQEKSVAHEELQPVPQPSTRDHAARKSPAMVGEEEAQTVGAEGLDIYSGNVPPPLTITDVVIFVDSIEDVEVIVKILNLVNLGKIVQPLTHLPSLIGTEKAVVVYVGRLNLSATDKVLHTLVLQLGDVMTLCQGQLILALEITSGIGQDVKQSSPDVGKPGPYELEIAAMLDQAKNQHSQQ